MNMSDVSILADVRLALYEIENNNSYHIMFVYYTAHLPYENVY